MALIFDQIADDQPQLHAFIIGVGGYRHMADGTEPREQSWESVGVLRQLTSPPRSALAFRDMLLNTQNQWKVPLGSIEFLLSHAPSDAEPDGTGKVFEAATIANIKTAFSNWFRRCEKHEDNIALFYFCGHGVEKGEQYLLAEDFGANINPWDGSFSFDSTRLAFHRVKAKTQIFLVDACRKITSQMLQSDLPEIPLLVPDLSPECPFNLTIKAAARNEEAMGPKMQASYFTQALLKVFEQGALAERSNNQKWVIKSGQIAAGITKVLKNIKDTEDFKQRCTIEINESSQLFTTDITPMVDVSITVDEQAKVFYQKFPDGPQQDRKNGSNPWEFNTEAGFYHIGLELNTQAPNLELVSFEPPSFEVIL